MSACVRPFQGPIANTASVSGDQPDPDTGNNTASQGTTVVSTPTGGTLEVRKVLSPTSDTGVFNLQIDGTTVTANAGNGGTTGKRPVSTGDHTVGETAGTGTILSDYTSATTCKDQGGAGSTIASSTGAGVLHVNVTANADVVCTITNTRRVVRATVQSPARVVAIRTTCMSGSTSVLRSPVSRSAATVRTAVPQRRRVSQQ